MLSFYERNLSILNFPQTEKQNGVQNGIQNGDEDSIIRKYHFFRI